MFYLKKYQKLACLFSLNAICVVGSTSTYRMFQVLGSTPSIQKKVDISDKAKNLFDADFSYLKRQELLI